MKDYDFDPKNYETDILQILNEIDLLINVKERDLRKILTKYPKDGNQLFSRDQLVAGYQYLVSKQKLKFDQSFADKIKMKPMRTRSGVTPVTVLTKPFPCPGKCIFCPNDVRMPKSYLADEPGAQRAEMNMFDPYLQTYNRLLAFTNIGHNVEKVELIVLGGTWSFYPETYQIWFIKRCFDAMNDFGVIDKRADIHPQNIFEHAESISKTTDSGRGKSYNEIIAQVVQKNVSEFFATKESATWEELHLAHSANELAKCKNVGLVIETRPDYIDEKEVIKIRKLGATKVQIGIQSLDDEIMDLNKRGHGSKETAEAIRLLRLAGFKIHGHWMPNLYGSNVDKDIQDYKRLWEKPFSPDELKIYPTSIIANTELFDRYKEGKYKPYSYDELLEVLTNTLPITPRYCRLTRIIRDIPSTDIVAGNKMTNFRQIAENQIQKEGKFCECVRCREIKDIQISFDELELEVIEFETSIGKDYFISYKTKTSDKIAAFLRLSLPDKKLSSNNFIFELRNKSIIREVHVYGKVIGIGKTQKGSSQHIGLGTKLIEKANEISIKNGYKAISVISAIGTREYYKKKGFHIDDMYMSQELV